MFRHVTQSSLTFRVDCLPLSSIKATEILILNTGANFRLIVVLDFIDFTKSLEKTYVTCKAENHIGLHHLGYPICHCVYIKHLRN